MAMYACRLTLVSNHSNSLLFRSSRPGRPPKRAPVGLSLAASHLHHQQMKKHRLDNGDYPPYENGHMGKLISILIYLILKSVNPFKSFRSRFW